MRLLCSWFVRAVAVMFAGLGVAAAADDLQLGRDYTVLSPAQPTSNPSKIVVTEFFSYQCPHCFQMFPPISAWAAKLPKDVVFERVPVGFGRPDWTNIAQAFYALQAMGKVEKVDSAIFNAIHTQGVKLSTEANITDWLAKQGINAKEFSAAYNSFGVKSSMARMDQLIKNYKVEGVPSLFVDGKYVVSSNGIRSYDEMLARADKLIAKVRAERGGK